MALQKWELVHNPSDRDKDRWRLKLKIDERELMALMARVPGSLGRPILLENEEYDFSFYIYEISEQDLAAVRQMLQQLCPAAPPAVPTAPAPSSGGLDQMLESVARGFENLSAPAPTAPSPTVSVAAPSASQIPFQDLELNPGYTFEEFIIGPNNRFTAAAAQAVADNPGKIYNPFFIYGGVGLGKTHMMHAVGHYIRRKIPAMRIMYLTTEKFMSEVIEAIRKGTLLQMREHYRQVDLLLVDDIQFLVESESTQEEFFHTFNILHQSGRQIIITSDRPPKQLTTLEDRLRSRFEWGLIADIKSPNLETRVAILKKKGETEHVKLDDNILLYIASKLKSNIRELEGFLKRINAYAALTHQEVNMDLVQSLMSDLLPVEEEELPPPPPVAARSVAPQVQPVPVEPPVTAAPPVPVQPSPVPPPTSPFTAWTQQAPPPAPLSPAVQQAAAQPPAPPLPIPVAPIPPPKPLAPPPRPAAPVSPVAQSGDPADAGLKPVEVAFFFPEGKQEALITVKERFREVIRKHKLKFRLDGIFESEYAFLGKIDYPAFASLCKDHKVAIAVVLGPPADATPEFDDFGNLLATVMDDEKLSLQLVSWNELNKDYRYLNLALDITLLRHRG